jgi:gluconokinase
VIVIIFGVSGAGKTTIGEMLAQELGWQFYEADDFHPQANIDKMGQGIPLTDEDRWPWLERLHKQIERSLEASEDAVLACSALKEKYRRYLRLNDQVKLVFLRGDYELIADRLRKRRGHFMDPELLQSQFDDLEEPQPGEGAVVIELEGSPRELVQEIKSELQIGL